MASLTQDASDEAVASFCAVTGADESNAHHFLAAAAGDVDMAVSLFLDSGLDGTAAGPPPAGEIRAPIQPQRSVLVDEDPHYSNYNFNNPSSTHFVPPTEPFRDFRSEALPFTEDASSQERGRRLAELFRPPTEIMFRGGSFEQARKSAREQFRWLLVTVHCPTEFPCQQMVRDVWNDPAIQDFVRESLIFLFLTINTTEADRYRQYYPFDGFPHWALIDPRTGKRVKSSNTILRSTEMLQELVEYVSDHSLRPLETLVAKRNSPITLEELEESSDVQPKAAEGALCKSKSAVAIASLPEEPAADNPQTIIVQIRMPDGTRQKRRFFNLDKISLLFDYVKSLDPEISEFDVLVVLTSGLHLTL